MNQIYLTKKEHEIVQLAMHYEYEKLLGKKLTKNKKSTILKAKDILNEALKKVPISPGHPLLCSDGFCDNSISS